MANVAATNGADVAKSGPWTENEKYTFLLQIINQLSADKPIKFAEINMPGRTPKACTHAWAKIRAEAAAYNSSDGGTPKPKTPRKKNLDAGADIDSPAKKKSTPKKKAAAVQELKHEAEMIEVPSDE